MCKYLCIYAYSLICSKYKLHYSFYDLICYPTKYVCKNIFNYTLHLIIVNWIHNNNKKIYSFECIFLFGCNELYFITYICLSYPCV